MVPVLYITITELEEYIRTIKSFQMEHSLIFGSGAGRYTCMLHPTIAFITRIALFNAGCLFLATVSAPSVAPFPAGRPPLWREW